MAMEDAVCLAHNLEKAGNDVETALSLYQQQRVIRTARVQVSSRLIGEYIYHPDDAIAAVRNDIMSRRSPQEWYEKLHWLYGSNGLQN